MNYVILYFFYYFNQKKKKKSKSWKSFYPCGIAEIALAIAFKTSCSQARVFKI